MVMTRSRFRPLARRSTLAAVCGLCIVAAVPPTAGAAPAEPVAPPVANADNLGPTQCAPPSTTVVRTVPWAQQRLDPQRVWPITRGNGQAVAVIDSGVDASVPQLAGHVLPGYDASSGHGTANTDCLGHGTFVAGIIAAQQAAGIGFTGVAPGATILPVRQTVDGTTGSADTMAAAITWAVAHGARIINVSAASQYTSPRLASAVQQAISGGALIVASVSNDAQGGNPKAYPAAYPGVMGVAAIGQDGSRAPFSETGGYVSVAAPGENILSLGPRGAGDLIGNGTSFAAPFVSGVAALVWAAHPELTAAGVAARIELTADHPSTSLPDPEVGWGVVNAYAAVTQVLPQESRAMPSPSASALVPAPLWPRHDGPALDRAATETVLVLVAALLVVLVAVVVARVRLDGWRSADPVTRVTGSVAGGGAVPETSRAARADQARIAKAHR